MGRQNDPQIVASMGLYPDEALQNYVDAIGQRMAAVSERPELPWTFRVIDDPTVNAFAVPGGFIYFTRGILAHMANEAQFATVMGHEIGHVTARHSAAQISRAQLATAGLVVGSILSPEVASVAGAAQQSLGLLFLKFGRDDERQSDELAFRDMARTNYDVRQVPEVFEMLRRVSASEGAGRVPEWASTHPDPGNRRDQAQQTIAALPAGQIGTIVRRDEFLRMLDDVVYGVNPREGYFRGQRFIHPDLTFELTFPDGWQTQNQKQAVVALSPTQDAIMQMTLAEGSAAQTAQTFLAQEGLQATQPRRRTINGLTAVTAEFAAQTEQQGTLQGLAAWIELDGRTYQLLGYGTQQRWSSNQAAVERGIGSFARVTDRSLLNVQPDRLDIVQIDRAMTLSEFAQRYRSSVDIDDLVLLNQADGPDQRFPSGTLLKRVVAGG
jgi:predicted Zn-dependent protease